MSVMLKFNRVNVNATYGWYCHECMGRISEDPERGAFEMQIATNDRCFGAVVTRYCRVEMDREQAVALRDALTEVLEGGSE